MPIAHLESQRQSIAAVELRHCFWRRMAKAMLLIGLRLPSATQETAQQAGRAHQDIHTETQQVYRWNEE